MADVIAPYFDAVERVDPSPESPSRRPGESFFTWLDRMHARPPTVCSGEVYANGYDVVEVLDVCADAVRWRVRVPGALEQRSYRVTFEEWAADPETTRRAPLP